MATRESLYISAITAEILIRVWDQLLKMLTIKDIFVQETIVKETFVLVTIATLQVIV